MPASPAFNQLAIYYLERAKEKVGRAKGTVATAGRTSKTKEKKIDQQQLELAALVCSQAIRKNPKYPAIHNTAGLIQVELGNINSAVSSFKTASDLDPGFFEAQMNYAAVNLSFRGFKNAEDAYRSALKIKPNDYDAHLGLALALRGQINDSNFDANVKAAQEELDKAKGWLAELKGRVAMSTFEISYGTIAPAASSNGVGGQLGEATQDSAATFLIGLRSLLTLAIYLIPWLIFAAPVVLAIRWFRRRTLRPVQPSLPLGDG